MKQRCEHIFEGGVQCTGTAESRGILGWRCAVHKMEREVRAHHAPKVKAQWYMPQDIYAWVMLEASNTGRSMSDIVEGIIRRERDRG